MKKSLLFVSLMISLIYLSFAINITLNSGDKLESSSWTGLSSVLNKVDVSGDNLSVNGKIAVNGKICDESGCLGECTGNLIWDVASSSCKAKPGWAAETASKTCKTLKDENPSYINGKYWIDPDGDGGSDPFEAYCNMTLAGGGWTLLATQKDGHYFSTSNVDNYTADGISKDANKYSILGKVDLFTSDTYSGYYEFLYRDDVNNEDRRLTVKQTNVLSSTTPTGYSTLSYSPYAPRSDLFKCFYRMPGGSAAGYNKYGGNRSNWQFGLGQYKDRGGRGLVTGQWSDGKNYSNTGSTKYEFYVR